MSFITGEVQKILLSLVLSVGAASPCSREMLRASLYALAEFKLKGSKRFLFHVWAQGINKNVQHALYFCFQDTILTVSMMVVGFSLLGGECEKVIFFLHTWTLFQIY